MLISERINSSKTFTISKTLLHIEAISKIDYLAVQEEYRNQDIGSTIISQLAQLAKSQGRHFLTVDAFHDEGYSAIPFYEKNHFIAVEDYKKEQDTQRMFLFIG